MDGTGKPAGKPLGGQISVTIESQGKYDLFHWMKEPEQTKDGSIVFFKRDAMSKLQEVKFSKAYCVSLEEEFDANDEMPMQKRIVISAQTITVGDMVFENSWGGNKCMDVLTQKSRQQRLKRELNKSLASVRLSKSKKLTLADKSKIKKVAVKGLQRYLTAELKRTNTKTYDWYFKKMENDVIRTDATLRNNLGYNRYFIIDYVNIPINTENSYASYYTQERVREFSISSKEIRDIISGSAKLFAHLIKVTVSEKEDAKNL